MPKPKTLLGNAVVTLNEIRIDERFDLGFRMKLKEWQLILMNAAATLYEVPAKEEGRYPWPMATWEEPRD